MSAKNFRGRMSARVVSVLLAAAVGGTLLGSAQVANAQLHGPGALMSCDPACVGENLACAMEARHIESFQDSIEIKEAFFRVDPFGDNIRLPAAGNLPIVSVSGNTTCTVGGTLPCLICPPGFAACGGDSNTGSVFFATPPPNYQIVASDGPLLSTFGFISWEDNCEANAPGCPFNQTLQASVGGTTSIPNCDDLNPCTNDSCDFTTNQCVFDPKCVTNADCDDQDPCTIDVCDADGPICCLSTPVPNEACCLPDDTCQLLCPAQCAALGGTSQGPGSTCTLEACCVNDSCELLDPECCALAGGTSQGPGSTCTTEGCCDPKTGTCTNEDPECCILQGGTPQGPGNLCTMEQDCCLNAMCVQMDPLCCEEQGGVPNGCDSGECAPGGEGCTPGYWKLIDSSPANASHECNWTDPYDPGDNYDATFGVDSKFDSQTLHEALKLGGGGEKAMRRHSVAALLNAASCAVNYPYTVAEVIAAVQAAYAGTLSFSEVHTMLADANEAEEGCPLANCFNGPAPCDEPLSNCCIAHGGIGCDNASCEAAVCAIDSFCCDVAWDGICADEAVDFCGALCPPPTNCCTAHGGLGCDNASCEANVCAIDPFCCDTLWDGICVCEAGDECGGLCPTCASGSTPSRDNGFKTDAPSTGDIERSSEVGQDLGSSPVSNFAPVSACGATGLLSLCVSMLGIAGVRLSVRRKN